MTLLANFARYEIGILLAVFAGVIAYQLLTGGIKTRGLLCEKTKAGLGGVSAARVQLLLFTLAMAFYVLSQVIELRKFPEIETKWLLMLGGSHSVFLGAKGVLSLFSSEPK
ncbi:MAG TPA: hypothetical protein VGJ37_05525 [Pyrinomonadaceae bacterium]|jgi:hypothetical protein